MTLRIVFKTQSLPILVFDVLYTVLLLSLINVCTLNQDKIKNFKLQTSAPPTEPPVGDEHDVTLINGGCTWGFVYITKDEKSGHICDTNWRDVNADVICRHVGYSAGRR